MHSFLSKRRNMVNAAGELAKDWKRQDTVV